MQHGVHEPARGRREAVLLEATADAWEAAFELRDDVAAEPFGAMRPGPADESEHRRSGPPIGPISYQRRQREAA